jgi:hypothetical protein
VSSQHKKPILAFVVLAVVAAAMIANQVRASADRSQFIAAGPIAAHSGRTHGVIPVPAGPDAQKHAASVAAAVPADEPVDSQASAPVASAPFEAVDPQNSADGADSPTEKTKHQTEKPKHKAAHKPSRPSAAPGKVLPEALTDISDAVPDAVRQNRDRLLGLQGRAHGTSSAPGLLEKLLGERSDYSDDTNRSDQEIRSDRSDASGLADTLFSSRTRWRR